MLGNWLLRLRGLDLVMLLLERKTCQLGVELSQVDGRLVPLRLMGLGTGIKDVRGHARRGSKGGGGWWEGGSGAATAYAGVITAKIVSSTGMSGTYPVAVSEYGLGVGRVGGEIGKHGCSIHVTPPSFLVPHVGGAFRLAIPRRAFILYTDIRIEIPAQIQPRTVHLPDQPSSRLLPVAPSAMVTQPFIYVSQIEHSNCQFRVIYVY